MMQASNMECMVSHGGEIPDRRSEKRRRDTSTAEGGEGDTTVVRVIEAPKPSDTSVPMTWAKGTACMAGT